MYTATGCASPPAIYHAAILDGDYVSYVVYKCGTGFMFSDGESSHGSWCQVDLTWSLKESECIGKTIMLHNHTHTQYIDYVAYYNAHISFF